MYRAKARECSYEVPYIRDRSMVEWGLVRGDSARRILLSTCLGMKTCFIGKKETKAVSASYCTEILSYFLQFHYKATISCSVLFRSCQ